MKTPKGYTEVQTEDGSITLFSERFGEACHSTSGARNETVLHYIEGCEILTKAQANQTVNILEVGFGLGLGLLTTWEKTQDLNAKIKFISLEIDPVLPEWFKEVYKDHPIFHDPKFEFEILVGDARKTLPDFIQKTGIKWDAIYQDAFSPKRNPILWTTEWFTLLKDSSNDEVVMSTYSASSSIRKSMNEAGWKLRAGEKFGPKRASTRARLIGETDPEILLALSRSPVKALADKDIP